MATMSGATHDMDALISQKEQELHNITKLKINVLSDQIVELQTKVKHFSAYAAIATPISQRG